MSSEATSNNRLQKVASDDIIAFPSIFIVASFNVTVLKCTNKFRIERVEIN